MALSLYWTFNALILLAIAASAILWVRLLYRVVRLNQSGADVLPVRPRQRPFWTPADFLVMFGTFAVLVQLCPRLMVDQGWIQPSGDDPEAAVSLESKIAAVAAMIAAGLGALAITLTWLRLCNRDAWRLLGLLPTKRDIILGLRGALMILPPVLMISFAASYFVPYEHQVLDDLASSPQPALFVAIFAATAIVTPIVEEFTFRVLLQGGLQGMVDRNVDADGDWRPQSHWPVVATSLLFAVMHYNQGAAQIPLFFMSLGLGYLYRQTGKFAPAVLVHMILNGTTLCVLFAELQSGAVAGQP
jgi:membrane protease YdiL (CAAX protease family)